MFGKSLLHLVPLCIACLVSPSVHGTSTHVTRQVLADFTSGGPTGTAVSDTNSPARGASSSVRTVTSYEGSNRLQMTDGGYVNGFYITFSGALQSEGNYLVTARVKVVNSSSAPISSFGLAVKSGAASTSKISDVNAGYVMNLATHSTDGATLGWQTIGAAVQASGTFPQDLTVYFSTDPSRGNHSSVPTTDGDFENAHRDSSALLWGSGAAVYIDDVTLVGPGNMGEDRHVWVNLYDGASDALTNQASLENILVTARNNHMNCIDIMARFRANRYYRKNRDYSTYPNNEPYGSGASDAFDALQYAIDRGHELGLKVYATFGTFLVTSGSGSYPGSLLPADSITWVYNSGSPRAMTTADDSEGLWADPGREDVRAYTRNVIMDVVKNYDIDGVLFDRVRYSNREYGYNPTALSEMGISGTPAPTDSNFMTKRREAITTFLADTYTSITTLKPWVVVGSAPIAYSCIMNETYNYVFQFWPMWNSRLTANRAISFGCQDLMQPQFYNTTAATVESGMIKAQFGDLTYYNRDFGLMPGAMVNLTPTFYHPNSTYTNSNAQTICDSRQAGTYWTNGFAIYRATPFATDFAAINAVSTTPCGTNVLSSDTSSSDYLMKASYDNAPPAGVPTVSASLAFPNIDVTWTTPPAAADGELPSRYLVYRSQTLPVRQIYANLCNRNTVVTGNSFADTPAGGLGSGTWYYIVVPVDDYNNKGGSATSGAVTINLDLIVESKSTGQNFDLYSETQGAWSDSSAKSTATGCTPSIHTQWILSSAKPASVRFSLHPARVPAGDGVYKIFYTCPNVSSAYCNNCKYSVMTRSGSVATGYFNANRDVAGNVWYEIGQFELDPDTGYIELSNVDSTSSGTNRFYADAIKFAYQYYVPVAVSAFSVE